MTNDQLSVQPDETGAAQIMYDISRGHLVDGPLPEALRSYEGAPVESGLSLQLAVLDQWIAAGETIGGYKWVGRRGARGIVAAWVSARSGTSSRAACWRRGRWSTAATYRTASSSRRSA